MQREERRMERLAANLKMPAPSIAVLKAAKAAMKSENWSYFSGQRGTRLMTHLVVEDSALLAHSEVVRAFRRQLKKHPSKSSHSALLQVIMAVWGQDLASELREIVNSMESPSSPHPMAEYVLSEDGAWEFAQAMPTNPGKSRGFFESVRMPLTEDQRPFLMEAWRWKIMEVMESTTSQTEMERTLAWLDWVASKLTTPLKVFAYAKAILVVESKGWDTGSLMEVTMAEIGGVEEAVWQDIQALDEADRADVREGRDTLEGWVNELFLERFWKVVEDKRRRRFWRGHVKEMRKVKLILDDFLYRQVGSQLRERAYRKRVYHGNSGGVLMFQFRGKLFVEFGGQAGGALQVVPLDHWKLRKLSVELERYSSSRPGFNLGGIHTSELKFYGKEQVIYLGGRVLSEFGKFNHAGNWESSLREWMRSYARD